MEEPLNMSMTPNTQAQTSLATENLSSNLFQNAADFEIVGGQFVSGDIHYHAAPALSSDRRLLKTPSHPELSREPSEDSPSEYAESDLYCDQLLPRKRGFPLYVPGPQRNLPAEYQRKGVSIGDVGRVTPEGVFDFFFNIYLPSDHPINANDVPEDFSPLTPYTRKDVVRLDFDPGNYVSSSSIHAWDPDAFSEYVFLMATETNPFTEAL
ncbi:hypothetical protein DFH09DRAFT_1046350 [Mycena vulgaris]|nr:hypothetical protein DFH09DRAFT_1046350 [Mycena vulgaris]